MEADVNFIADPPDTRPHTLDLPRDLARAVGLTVLTPPKLALPQAINQPADTEVLQTWLSDLAPQADFLICSLEGLCLGGMIPARIVEDSLEQALQGLNCLRQIKKNHPKLRILAFGVIVRVAHGNDPYEEKPYFADYGDLLRDYSHHTDKFLRHQQPEDQQKLCKLQENIPPSYLRDWLNTRQRNHQLHQIALDFVAEGIIEHLCLTLDDTSSYGLAAIDRRALEAKVDSLGLWQQVDIYPGADEVPCTLLARALQLKASRVYVHYSSLLGAAANMRFEDRAAGELIKAHLRAAKCKLRSLAEADWILAVNVPAEKQVEQSEQPDYGYVDTAQRHLPEFIDFIADYLPVKAVAIADIAYPNGAERRFLQLLRQRIPLKDLAAFSAWNTAGNSLGTAITMAVCAPLVVDKLLWQNLLFNRFVDDYLYQGWFRQELAKALTNPNLWDLGPQQPEAETRLDEGLYKLASQLHQEHFNHYTFRWQKPYLAWPRLFTGVFPYVLANSDLKSDA
ncbi:MAG: DUF4127 family protein [Deinococcales bacterium]